MKCPKCNTELGIIKSRMVVEGDNSENEETKLYNEMDFACRNKNCENYQQIVYTAKNRIEIG